MFSDIKKSKGPGSENLHFENIPSSLAKLIEKVYVLGYQCGSDDIKNGVFLHTQHVAQSFCLESTLDESEVAKVFNEHEPLI